MAKTHKEIIYQYFPDGSHCGLNHFNENKVVRMIEEAVKIDRCNNGRFTVSDMISFANTSGNKYTENDLIQWLNN